MKIRIPWLGVIGLCVLVLGLVLGFQRWARAYPGLIILAGCLACAVCLMVNEGAWRPVRTGQEAGSDAEDVTGDGLAGSGL